MRSSPRHYRWRTISDGDGVSIFGGNHVWVDHCSLSNCEDWLIDAIMGSTAITLSNNYMMHHDKVMLLGDLIATKLAEPTNIYNSILYSLEFSLINLGYTHIQCVAYGALAHRLNAFWRSNTANVVVCGFNYVTKMEGGSDILFDSDIPEIQFFKSQIPSIDS
ncbi:hypothetical protein F2Q69_00011606 [Brassica cretica]|uniref:Pectate lyase n=1 Tax=Brassica cretica TaxID=69181 RepID=A0A8S9QTC4_BRACR|nr:hypothetical protein F2Q69_00011606 [Brassica cretica]